MQVPLHQCKSRHIAETSAWRERRAELDLLSCWRPSGEEAEPRHSRVSTVAARSAALQLQSALRSCCASLLWIEIAESVRAAERKGEARVRGVGEISPPDSNTMRTF